MTKAAIARWTLSLAVLAIAGAAGVRVLHEHFHPAPTSPASPSTTPLAETVALSGPEATQGFLYGRVTAVDGAVFEGRLRWGGREEAFWDDTFNGAKHENRWLAQLTAEQRPKERRPIKVFGVEIVQRERPSEVDRPFMRRFGEMARIEASRTQVLVTLKGGDMVDLDRFEASDFDDGVRVWDGSRGIVDLDSLRIRAIELLPTPALDDAPYRLQGTVHTRQGDFSGFIGWNREDCVGSDELTGRTAEGEVRLRFDTIRAMARQEPASCRVTLQDGREIVLSDSADVGDENRGIYVADRRYGRVLISWNAFERVDFEPGGSGPAYGGFPPGSPLMGRVFTRTGRSLAGRLVYDLDESETTETLDAPAQGVDYSLPFGSLASIVLPEQATEPARVTLGNGLLLQLERSGDLGPTNAGLLVFVEGGERPEYVPWSDVGQVDFVLPKATEAPPGES